MSTLVVEVCAGRAPPRGPTPALGTSTTKGWPVIVQVVLGLKPGDRAVYFLLDTADALEPADRLGITKAWAPCPARSTARVPGLQRAARLRGEPSTGRSTTASIRRVEVGRDVRDHYGVTKFEPPERPNDG